MVLYQATEVFLHSRCRFDDACLWWQKSRPQMLHSAGNNHRTHLFSSDTHTPSNTDHIRIPFWLSWNIISHKNKTSSAMKYGPGYGNCYKKFKFYETFQWNKVQKKETLIFIERRSTLSISIWTHSKVTNSIMFLPDLLNKNFSSNAFSVFTWYYCGLKAKVTKTATIGYRLMNKDYHHPKFWRL